MQNKFAFFANFAETIKELPEDMQPKAYQAVCEYGIYGTLPDDVLLRSICLMAKNSIYKDWGGAPAGNKNASKNKEEKQPQNNLKTTPKQPYILEKQKLETETEAEAETKTETKTEAETEEVSAVAPAETAAPKDEYVFEGEVIKLKQRNFDDWQRAYPHLNIYAECVVRDSWLKEQAETERKRWFMSTAAYFAKQNEKRKKQHEEEQQPDCAYGDYL